MKKLGFVLAFFLIPAMAQAFDVGAANTHHKKAWDELVKETNQIIHAPAATPAPRFTPYVDKMSSVQRTIVDHVNTMSWLNYVYTTLNGVVLSDKDHGKLFNDQQRYLNEVASFNYKEEGWTDASGWYHSDCDLEGKPKR